MEEVKASSRRGPGRRALRAEPSFIIPRGDCDRGVDVIAWERGVHVLDVALIKARFAELTDLTPLSSGGQKWVYSARHADEGPVVLKVIQPGGDDERIRREVIAVQMTRSPRVPAISDTGEIDTPLGRCLWLREPRIDGESVRAMLTTNVPLPRGEVIRLASHVLEALERAHGANIVHRDVKPDNVMRDRAGNYWLLDFGIARLLDLSSLTGTLEQYGPGTLGYAPYEQLRNQKAAVDGRVDLFALGVTMYECLTGVQPYRAGARDGLEVIERIKTQALPPPSLPDDPRGGLAEFVATLGQRRAEHRPESASEALASLRELAGA